jgi:hypothetical protein
VNNVVENVAGWMREEKVHGILLTGEATDMLRN